MASDTSIGPAPTPPEPGQRATRRTSEGVDAQNANEFDSRHGIAGIEAKPFAPRAPAGAPDARPGVRDEREAAASQPEDDPNRKNPNARPDLLAMRRKAGAASPRRPETPASGERTGRDDTLDADLDRERLQPGLNSDGTGGAGADPDGHHEDANSNT